MVDLCLPMPCPPKVFCAKMHSKAMAGAVVVSLLVCCTCYESSSNFTTYTSIEALVKTCIDLKT